METKEPMNEYRQWLAQYDFLRPNTLWNKLFDRDNLSDGKQISFEHLKYVYPTNDIYLRHYINYLLARKRHGCKIVQDEKFEDALLRIFKKGMWIARMWLAPEFHEDEQHKKERHKKERIHIASNRHIINISAWYLTACKKLIGARKLYVLNETFNLKRHDVFKTDYYSTHVKNYDMDSWDELIAREDVTLLKIMEFLIPNEMPVRVNTNQQMRF